MDVLTIRLTHGGSPLYEQIYRHIREEIRKGAIQGGEKLPSKRRLAAHLGVSLNTVDNAYAQLVDEGYLEPRAKSGYYVCRIERARFAAAAGPAETEPAPRPQFAYDFSPSGVDLKSFPYSLWRRLYRDVLAGGAQTGCLAAGDPCGEYELRQQIARYLHASRGVRCTPAQVVVGAGGDFLLQLLSQLLGGGRRFAMEDPVYNKAYKILEGMGNTVVPTPLDAHGLSLVSLQESGADTAYITPSHQFPLGIIMPISRRMQLYEWACEREGRYIVEDDYDSEFRYRGRPIPALQGVDGAGRVIYLGTFSQSVAPSMRIGYLVLPPDLLHRMTEDFGFYSCTVSRVEQRVLAGFLQDGHFERHLNRMRKLYGRRREAFTDALHRLLPGVRVSGDRSGLYLLLRVPGKRTEPELDALAQKKGVKLYPLSGYYFGGVKAQGDAAFLAGYANHSEEEIVQGVRLLAQAWSE